jgi:quercetin dioxygenase-like cupin family protein
MRQVISNAVTGERIVIRTTAEESDGTLLAFDLFLPPGGHVPARHAHPVQEERFTIVDGALEFHIANRRIQARAGDTVIVPPRTPHWFGNREPLRAHALVEVRPALRMAELLAMSESVVRQPLVKRLPALARLLVQFQPELAVPHIPPRVLRVLLAPIARA